MNAINKAWPNKIPEVGQTAHRSRTVTHRDIELFTEISGDRNPLHYERKSLLQHILVALWCKVEL